MLNKLKALWNGVPDGVKRVIHTFWQAFVAGLIVSVVGVHDLSSAKVAVVAAVAAGLSAVKGAVVAR